MAASAIPSASRLEGRLEFAIPIDQGTQPQA
jgi:hypothetical protein